MSSLDRLRLILAALAERSENRRLRNLVIDLRVQVRDLRADNFRLRSQNLELQQELRRRVAGAVLDRATGAAS